jgi:hypothetical protein
MKGREMLKFGQVVVAIVVEAVGLLSVIELSVIELSVKTLVVERGILARDFALSRDVSNLRNHFH